MWCGSMIYASQDVDSKGFVIFLTILVATMNIGMLIWLVVRLLMECVRENQEDDDATANGDQVGKIKRIMSNLQMSVQRWRDGRVSEATLQARIRGRTIDADDGQHNTTRENPAVQIEMVESTAAAGEVKVVDNEDTTAISILDAAAPLSTMHSNPHWKRLKLSVKASNTLKSFAGGSSNNNKQKRVKRLSTVMKARRNSALEQDNQETEEAKTAKL